jgi:hypothetical protein
MDSPIWGMTISVGMISFRASPIAESGPDATCNYNEHRKYVPQDERPGRYGRLFAI